MTQAIPQALVIRGGTVVNADREQRADVLCVDGRIVAVEAGLAAAAGEGITAAGSAAEQIRQETADGTLTPTQAGLAAATGAATAGFGALGAKVANRLGIADADTLMVQGAKGLRR